LFRDIYPEIATGKTELLRSFRVCLETVPQGQINILFMVLDEICPCTRIRRYIHIFYSCL